MFIRVSSWALVVVLFVVVGGAVAVGFVVGRYIRSRPDPNRESVGVVQATLLGLVGLLLAFGLTMAVGRYEARRALVVQEANAIGTTFLRAQMLAEPTRSNSLALLERYADAAIDIADEVPDSDQFDDDLVEISEMQRGLWTLAGDAVRADPDGTAPRLYIETLNEMIDTHTSRVASLRNRVPSTVVLLQVVGSADRARGVVALPHAARTWADHITRGCGRGDPDPVHLFRPRPSPARSDHRPVRTTGRGTSLDGACARRHRPLNDQFRSSGSRSFVRPRLAGSVRVVHGDLSGRSRALPC